MNAKITITVDTKERIAEAEISGSAVRSCTLGRAYRDGFEWRGEAPTEHFAQMLRDIQWQLTAFFLAELREHEARDVL